MIGTIDELRDRGAEDLSRIVPELNEGDAIEFVVQEQPDVLRLEDVSDVLAQVDDADLQLILRFGE